MRGRFFYSLQSANSQNVLQKFPNRVAKYSGNPYVIVFRMFKAMMIMIIIPAAVAAAFLVSG